MRKRITMIVVLVPLVGFSQQAAPVTSCMENRMVSPCDIQVAFTKTVHLLFPSAVVYVDLGSSDLLAGKAEGAQNIVRVKAAVAGFEGESSLSVLTADGLFYTFHVTYNENPGKLSVDMSRWISQQETPPASENMTVPLPEKEEEPLLVRRIMHAIYAKDVRDLKTVGSKQYGVMALLRGIYIHNDWMFFHLKIRNFTHVPFEIGYVRFKIADKKIARRTAVQETYVEPMRIYSDLSRIGGRESARNVYVFRKIALTDDKRLIVEIFEKDGLRHQSFAVENADLIRAKPIRIPANR